MINEIILNEEQIRGLEKLKKVYQHAKEIFEITKRVNFEAASSDLHGTSILISAKKREIIQGEWLIPIKGGLTEKELQKKINYLKSYYVGKKVLVNGMDGIIFGNSFGKIGVIFKDHTKKYVSKNDIAELENIDEKIENQKIMIKELFN